MSTKSNTSKPKKKRFRRNFGLDLLRFVAISTVLAFHGYVEFFLQAGLSTWDGWHGGVAASAVFSMEWLFCLSGFLIGSMMIRSFDAYDGWWQSARDFWLRRWFRTIPNYYLFVVLNILLAWWGLEQGQFSWLFPFFSQNLFWAQKKPYFFSESWSLALDEWFYFVMPLLLGLVAMFAQLSRKGKFWVVALLLIVVPTVLRTLIEPAHDFFQWDHEVRRVTIYHIDSTGWGVLAAILSRWHQGWWTQNQGKKALLGLIMTLGAAAAMFWFVTHDWRAVAGGHFNDLLLMTMPAAGTVLAMPWLAARSGGFDWLRKWGARLGDYSYSVYLCHYPMIMLTQYVVGKLGLSPQAHVAWIVLGWLLAVWLLSALIFHSFEKPVSDLRERFTQRVQAGPFQARAESSKAKSIPPSLG